MVQEVLHPSVLLEMLELANPDDVARIKPLDCAGIHPLGPVGPVGLGTLLLRCSRNILILRSESGRTIGWAQAHFFVAAGGDEHSTGLGRGVFK